MAQETGRRRGRPALVEGDTTTSVNVRVSSQDYDRAYWMAQRDRVSVPDVFRRGLSRVLRDDEED